MRHDRLVFGRYRATGADLPFSDPRRCHGVAMEGYFWRLTDPAAGRVVVALCGVNRARDGRTWAIAGLASHPGGFVRHAVVPVGEADRHGLGVVAGDVFRAGPGELHVDLGPDARLSVALDDVAGWGRRRAYGGLGIAHAIPALGQYWHPHALGGRATGTAMLDGTAVELVGASVYAEKNWSRSGFPPDWWWGQASSFAGADACVAFAGGDVRLGPVGLTATAVVVRIEGRVLRLGNPATSPVSVEVTDERWLLRGHGARHSVEVEGWAPLGSAHVLPVPLPTQHRTVPGSLQHLDGRLRVRVLRGRRLVFEGESALAGLEHGGRERAVAELERRALALAA